MCFDFKQIVGSFDYFISVIETGIEISFQFKVFCKLFNSLIIFH